MNARLRYLVTRVKRGVRWRMEQWPTRARRRIDQSRLVVATRRFIESRRKHEPATVEAEAALRDRLRDAGSGAAADGPLVSIVVPTGDSTVHLPRLLAALASTAYERFEVIVVLNGRTAGTGPPDDPPRPFALRTLPHEGEAGFAAAVNAGIRAARGELILLLNDDTEPASPHWLGSMVEAIAPDDVGCVGARLIYPRRPGLRNMGDTIHPDLTLQHRGVHFVADPDGIPRARHIGSGTDPFSLEARSRAEVPAVTAACMLVDRAVLERADLLDEAYRFGTEDVELCLRIREQGKRIVYEGAAVLFHHEYGTQNREQAGFKRANREHNRSLFVDRWGPRISRQVLVDQLLGQQEWSLEPLRIGITVNRDDPGAGFGEYFTAHELGGQLELLGLEVSYLEVWGHRWRDRIASVDVVVSLLDGFPLDEVPRGILTVAWIRNWTERWIERRWFDDIDLVFASSRRSLELIEARSPHRAELMPLATNAERFHPLEPDPALAAAVVFAGNHWGIERAVTAALPGLAGDYEVGAYGMGWNEVPGMERCARGSIEYERLPALYSSAALVLDDSSIHTLPYGAVNSRVFDALASGALVASNDADGVRELFDDDFPVWNDEADLRRILAELGTERRAELAERYRGQVLASHTYRHRAEQLRDALLSWARARRFGIAIGVPNREEIENWGDYHYARALQRQLQRSGHPTRVHLLADWQLPQTARDDVSLHLFGLSQLEPRGGQLTVLWNISHPELVTADLLARYQLVLVASKAFASEVEALTEAPVHFLAQATDPDRFFPDPGDRTHELLFVGNSRRVQREVVGAAARSRHQLTVYGADWSPALIDQALVAGERIPNSQLRHHYSAAAIVLNDHWPDMRERGFLSNRLYDALACGACVVSDHVEGIEAEFDGAVATFADTSEVGRLLDRLMADPTERAERGERGRAAVLDRHTFAIRTEQLLGWTAPLLGEAPALIAEDPGLSP